MTREACLAIMYLLYGLSSANTKYTRIAKDANATVINVANESLNIIFIINPLRTTYPKIGSIGLYEVFVVNNYIAQYEWHHGHNICNECFHSNYSLIRFGNYLPEDR